MTCRDTERLWNDLLDARGGHPAAMESELEAHAAACPACAGVAARYRALRRAISAWAPPPVAAPEFVDRLRHARPGRSSSPSPVPARRPWSVRRPAWLPVAAAAAAAIVVGLVVRRGVPAGGGPEGVPAPQAPHRSIVEALADATSATIDLAREASAPAGRVGRVVLSSGASPEADAPLALRASVGPSTDILLSIGDRVGAGVRPLSGSARQAFGFLLRSTAGEPPADRPRPPPRGS